MRHLIFSLYPRRLPDRGWRRSVRELTTGARWQQFDGVRVVAVAEDECCDSRQTVIDSFPEGTEFLFSRNTALQETEQFIPLLRRVSEVYEPGDLILRAHSKSCTHKGGSPSALWLHALAVAHLDYPELVDCAMTKAHIAGAFRTDGVPFGSSFWHFAGSWYWLDAAELFKRDWGYVDRCFFGVESYPGTHFRIGNSFNLFFPASTADLYGDYFQSARVGLALKYWQAALAECGLKPLASVETQRPAAFAMHGLAADRGANQ